MKEYYLDGASTTRVSDKVLEEMLPWFSEKYGNPGSEHAMGREAARAVANARERVAEFLGAQPDQIVFTSGGTEANALAIKGLSGYMSSENKNVVLYSSGEHESVVHAVEDIAGEDGVVKAPVAIGLMSDGRVNAVELQHRMAYYNGHVGLVSVQYINNETGSMNNVSEIAKMVHHESGSLFHTDCVQAAPYKQINVDEIGCDFLTISGHKIGGPKGIGALYVRDKTLLTPLFRGGKEQEFGIRGGTENVPCIVGLGAACYYNKVTKENEDMNIATKVCFMSCLKDAMLQKTGTAPFINGMAEPETPSRVLNLHFKGVDGATLQQALSSLGIYVSVGSACRSHEVTPSYVLKAMGFSDDHIRQSIRVCLPYMMSVKDSKYIAGKIADCIGTLLSFGEFGVL